MINKNIFYFFDGEGGAGGGDNVPTFNEAVDHGKQMGQALASLDVLRAGHEALATAVDGTNAAVNDLGTRIDSLFQAQKETAEELLKLKPAEAANAELEGAGGAVSGTDAPGGTENIAEKTSDSLMSRIHRAVG